jgi:hypothetical protein
MTAGNTTSIKVTLPSDKEIVLTREFQRPAEPGLRGLRQARAFETVVGPDRLHADRM